MSAIVSFPFRKFYIVQEVPVGISQRVVLTDWTPTTVVWALL